MAEPSPITRLAGAPLQLWVENDTLRFRTHSGKLSPDLKQIFSSNKQVLKDLISRHPHQECLVHPLSYNQRSLWFLNSMVPDTAAYNVGLTCRFTEQIDVEQLRTSLEKVVDRHEALRTTYLSFDGVSDPIQLIHRSMFVSLKQMTVSTDETSSLQQAVESSYTIPVDIQNGPILNASFFKDGTQSVLLIVLPHIACDAWSLGIIARDLNDLYTKHLSSPEGSIPQYQTFTTDQIQLLQGSTGNELQSEWVHILDGATPFLNIPSSGSRSPIPKFKGATREFELSSNVCTQIKSWAREAKVSTNAVLLTATKKLLRKASGESDITIGVPVSGRSNRSEQGTVGYLVNTLPHRSDIPETAPFVTSCRIERSALNTILDLQKYPFGALVQHVPLPRDPSRTPVFQVLYNYLQEKGLGDATPLVHPSPAGISFDFCGINAQSFPIHQQEGQFDLTFEPFESENSIWFRLKYDNTLFTTEDIDTLVEDYTAILTSGLLENPKESVDTTGLSPSHQKTSKSTDDKKSRPIQVVAASTYTIEPIEQSLRFWLDKLEYNTEITYAPFNQIVQQLLNPSGVFSQNSNGINALFIRITDWINPNLTDQFSHIQSCINDMYNALSTAVKVMPKSTFIIQLSPSSAGQTSAISEDQLIHYEDNFYSSIARISNTYVYKPEHVAEHYQVDTVFDPVSDEQGSVPYTPEYFTALGTITARRIRAIIDKPIKVIVLDCDNTLWRGIIAEDGINAIEINSSYQQFQRALFKQKSMGRILALCSKNIEADVKNVFDTHPDMVLTWKDISFHRINWDAKSQNITSLAEEINVGLDSFLLIDDSPAECAEVSSSLPQILTCQFPVNDTAITNFIKRQWYLDSLSSTQEDSQRGQLYQDDAHRRQLQQRTLSHAEFIESLNLSIDIHSARKEEYDRIAQLTLRTNQFNFTGLQISPAEIEERISRDTDSILTTHVKDRFGDYGLVGVVLIERSAHSLIVQNVLLSCRALGRGVEYAMLRKVGKIAQSHGMTPVDIVMRPTPRNLPARQFLKTVLLLEQENISEDVTVHIDTARCVQLVYKPDEHVSAQNEKSPAPHAADISVSLSRSRVAQEMVSSLFSIEKIHPVLSTPQKAQHKSASDTINPSNELERNICTVWETLLGTTNISTTQNFFDLGGTSFQLPQMVSMLKQSYNVTTTIVNIFQHPTISTLAESLAPNSTNSKISEARDKGSKQRRAMQQSMLAARAARARHKVSGQD